MDADKLVEAVKRQPFEPVRVFVSDGASYEVVRPDQVMITRRTTYIGIGRNGKKAFLDNAVIDNIRVTRIEPLRTNGKPGKRKR